MPKKKQPKGSAHKFEDDLERLSEILRDIEDGTIGIDQMLETYKEGAGIIKRARDKINAAMMIIEEVEESDS
jgi:exodeoxyribonuclease VII small subunit